MKRRSLNAIIITGALSILLLFIVQFFWAKNLVTLENKQFNHKVKIGLLNAGYKLKIIHHSKIDKVHLVKQLNENSFVVEVQDIVNPTTIDSLLQQEFKLQELYSPYKIAIYDCFTDSVIYSHSGSEDASSVSAKDYGVDWNINSYNFGVIFPQTSTLEKYLGIGVTSGIVILAIVGFFSYVVIMLIQQKKLDEIKTDFINNMTHELKTPISTISLSSNVINQPDILDQPDRLKRYTQIIAQENERLKNQVERVLQLAFFEQKNFQLNFQCCNIKKLILQSIQPFELILQEKKGVLRIDGDDIMAEVDEQHLGNVFSNLLDNAIKYSGERVPELFIKITQQKNEVNIQFSDKGIGMDKEELKNIFLKFYRAPTGNIHNVKGFGIGLSYVDQIMHMHNGKIHVTSEKNKGTTFALTLPLKQD